MATRVVAWTCEACRRKGRLYVPGALPERYPSIIASDHAKGSRRCHAKFGHRHVMVLVDGAVTPR